MFYPLIPIGLTALFILYVLYLALIKKELKAKFKTVVLPGLFFLAIWAAIYFFVLT